MSVLSAVKSVLVSSGIVTEIFLSGLPVEPANCIALSDYPGVAPSRVLGESGVKYEQPRVQFLMRGTDHDTVVSVALAAYSILAEKKNTTISGVRYLKMTPLQSPFFLMTDENERPMYVFNLEVEKEV